MAKRRRSWNEMTFRKYLRNGRGQGEMSNYKPWICIQDFPSRGTVTRISGYKTGRVHHFMSRYETAFFYLLEWSDSVLDIREQYPLLNLELAVQIANESGIRYPRDNESNFPYVLTCDFMISTEAGLKARTVKQSAELNRVRTLEKLEIERNYWRTMGIDWKVVTESEIPFRKTDKLQWIYTAHITPDVPWVEEIMTDVEDEWIGRDAHILDVASWIEAHYKTSRGQGPQIVRHMLRAKRLPLYAIFFSTGR